MGDWIIYLALFLICFCSNFGVSLGMPPLLAPSEVLLGILLFQKYLIDISMPPCVHFLVWLVVWQVLDFVVPEPNLVQHE